jgi:DNA polymerase III subunit delta
MPPRRSSKSGPDPFERLEREGPGPVYAVDGEERLLVDEFVRALKERSVPEHARDFNFEVHTGKDAVLSRVIDAALTLPAFSARRMVLVRQAEKINLSEPEPLLRYLKNPSETTTLVFVADKFDARGKVYKAFQKTGAAVRFARPKPSQMPDLVRRRAKGMGIAIDGAAVRMLVELVGPDMGAAVRALEMLDLYRGPGSERAIRAEDVSRVLVSVREESVFDLVDAIGQGDRVQALALLHRLCVDQREPGLRVLALIARHFRLLIRARQLLDTRTPTKAWAGALGLPPFLVDKMRRQAGRFSSEDLVRSHAAIKAVDQGLKGGRLRDVRQLERLALRLMPANEARS